MIQKTINHPKTIRYHIPFQIFFCVNNKQKSVKKISENLYRQPLGLQTRSPISSIHSTTKLRKHGMIRHQEFTIPFFSFFILLSIAVSIN